MTDATEILISALEEIAWGAPTEQPPETDYACGNTGDIEEMGMARQHYTLAQIARKAIAIARATRGSPGRPTVLGAPTPNVVQFPSQKAESVLVGPFSYYKVKVEGRVIPRLTGYPQDDGRITLIVDDRFMVDFEPDVAPRAAWLVAQALAVGEGFTHLGATLKQSPFAPEATEVTDGL